MENKHLSGTESLKIIEQMIGRAREEEKDSGMGWIIWGWMLFLASIVNYVMIIMDAQNKYIAWTIFGIASFIWIIYSVVLKRVITKPSVKVKTYTNELVDRMGIAFFISLLVMVFGNSVTGLNASGLNFGYLLLLYGFWMFIHASAFRDNLLKAGAFVNWAGALVIFIFYKDLGKNILLVHAACVALGYLVPGHIAQIRFGHNQHGQAKKSVL
jgi:hypothetical protein